MKRLLLVIIVLILVSGGLAGCATAESEVSPLTTTPTSAPEIAPDVVPASAPETAPDVVAEKVNDIETIMGRAERLGIKVQAIAHAGSSITISCQADSYTTFRDYFTALEESGLFSTPIPPPEGPPYVKGGSIKLEPKYQYIDMPAVYYEANQAPSPITASDAIAILVDIAEGSGIDVDPNVGKFSIPAPTIRQVKAAENTYQVLSFRNIRLKGDYEDVMAFISDLDSRKTLRTMVLTRVVISQIEVDSKIETRATVDVDIYTIGSYLTIVPLPPTPTPTPPPDETEAAATELSNVQSAVVVMMTDNGLSVLPTAVNVTATKNMNLFPDTTTAASKGNDTNGVAFAVGDGDGFVLFEHDITGGGANTSLVNYTATQYTKGTYIVDAVGTVTQVTTGYE